MNDDWELINAELQKDSKGNPKTPFKYNPKTMEVNQKEFAKLHKKAELAGIYKEKIDELESTLKNTSRKNNYRQYKGLLKVILQLKDGLECISSCTMSEGEMKDVALESLQLMEEVWLELGTDITGVTIKELNRM